MLVSVEMSQLAALALELLNDRGRCVAQNVTGVLLVEVKISSSAWFVTFPVCKVCLLCGANRKITVFFIHGRGWV